MKKTTNQNENRRGRSPPIVRGCSILWFQGRANRAFQGDQNHESIGPLVQPSSMEATGLDERGAYGPRKSKN